MKIVLIAFLICSNLTIYAESGTLIIAHGSMSGSHHRCGQNPTTWEKSVIHSVESIRNEVTQEVELAFGMWNTMCFDRGIEKLKRRIENNGGSLDVLNVLPLFISSHSTVIEMQKWMFGLKWFKPIPLEKVKKVNFDGTVHYLKAIDYHQSVSNIIVDRARHLLEMALTEGYSESDLEIAIVMHGPVLPHANMKWMEMGQQYLKDLMTTFDYHKGHVVSLQDDAPKVIKEKRTKELRLRVEKASKKNKKMLILPLLLSHGGIEKGIIERLKGLEYVWAGQTILPDPRLREFFLERIN